MKPLWDKIQLESEIHKAASDWLRRCYAFDRWDHRRAEDANPAFIDMRGRPLEPNDIRNLADEMAHHPRPAPVVRFVDGALVAEFEMSGAFPGHARVVRLIQHQGRDTNPNPDLPDSRDVVVRSLVRSDTNDVIAVDVSAMFFLLPTFDNVCGGARGAFHEGCGKLDCLWARRRRMAGGFLGCADPGYHDM